MGKGTCLPGSVVTSQGFDANQRSTRRESLITRKSSIARIRSKRCTIDRLILDTQSAEISIDVLNQDVVRFMPPPIFMP